MKFFNNSNEFKAREKTLKALKRTIERRQFDKDKMIELMYMWQSCIQQEVDLFKECTEILNNIAQEDAEAAEQQ